MALCSVVLLVGLEPTRCFHRELLRLLRLPFRHISKHTRVIVANYENKDGICTAVTLPMSILSSTI